MSIRHILPTIMADGGRRAPGFGGGGGGGWGAQPSKTTSNKSKSALSIANGLGHPIIQEQFKNALSNKKPSGSSGGASSSGGGSTGGVSRTSGSVASTPASTRPPIPKVPTYADLNDDMKRIYDNLKAYNPDYASLEAQQQAIRDLYAQQIGETRAFGEAQQSRLQSEMERSRRDAELARRESLGVFRDSRLSIEDQLQDIMRQQGTALSSRGLGDSGLAQLGGVQAQMVAGDAISQAAEGYYDYEEQLQRYLQDAEESFQQATVDLTQTVQSAVTQITQASAMSDADYARMIEDIKMRVADSQNTVEMMRKNLLDTQFQNEMARSQLQLGYDQFDESRRQFDISTQLQREQIAAQQAAANRSYSLQKQQLERAAADAANMSEQQKLDAFVSQAQAYMQGLPGAFNEASMKELQKSYGLTGNSVANAIMKQAYPAPVQNNSSSNSNSLWSRLLNSDGLANLANQFGIR